MFTVPDRRNLTENAAVNAFLKRSALHSLSIPFAFLKRSPLRSLSIPVTRSLSVPVTRSLLGYFCPVLYISEKHGFLVVTQTNKNVGREEMFTQMWSTVNCKIRIIVVW